MKARTSIVALLVPFIYFSSSTIAYAMSIFNGTWAGISNPEKKSIPLSVFTIHLRQQAGTITGSYCYVTQYGKKIDCDEGDAKNINGKINSNNNAKIEFYSFWGGAGGLATISVKGNELTWVVTKAPDGEFYGPMQYTLQKKDNSKTKNVMHDEALVNCPESIPQNNVFDASRIFQGARIAIEKGYAEHPDGDAKYGQFLVLYKPMNGMCKKEIFAKYDIEGGEPAVDSLFFFKLHGKVNVFTIVSWQDIHAGIQTFGKFYEIHAYEVGRGNTLIENKTVSTTTGMVGVDGTDQGQPSVFPYKTAADVKAYWRKQEQAQQPSSGPTTEPSATR